MKTPSRLYLMMLVAFGSVSAASAAPKTVTKAPPKITLIDSGAAPRKPLRLKFTKGDTQTVVVTMAQSQKVVVDGEPLPSVSVPQTIVTLKLHVESVRLDGEATLLMTIVDVHADADAKDANPAMVAAFDDALAPMSRVTGTFTMTSQGIFGSMTVKAPDDLPPGVDQMMDSFSQSMDQMSNPFPAEPVGLGATWSVLSDIDMLGIHVVATRTFELSARDNDMVTLAVTGEVHPAPDSQKNIPGMPEGVAAKYDSLSASAHGSTVLNLRDSTPRSGEISELVNVVTSGTNAGVDFKVDTQIDLKITIETPPPVAPETSVNKSK